MAAGIFLGSWVLLGLIVFFVAMRGGPGGARETLHSQSRRGRRAVTSIVAVVGVVGGIVVPGLVLAFNGAHKARVGPSGITLSAAQAHGREVFATKCATCHTLTAAHAVGRVGPNLDQLHPPSALILDAIANGRARGNGQMPAQLVEGNDARDLANFVAAVSGR
jgi:mono/diheme cytochrome c family protein